MSEPRIRHTPEAPASPSELTGRENETPGLDAASALDMAELYGFTQLPEREFFALSLDVSLLPVELPTEDEGPEASHMDEAAETVGAAATEEGGADEGGPAPGEDGGKTETTGADTDDPAPVLTDHPAETPDEKAILDNMARLVEEVAAETGVGKRRPPPASAAPADTPETTGRGFGADMSATLSELEKILGELTGKEPVASAPSVPVLAASPPPAPVKPWMSASRRAPRKVSRPLRAPTSVTGYALAAEDDTLLPLPDVESAPFLPGTPPPSAPSAPAGPSWNKLWGARLAHEHQAAPAAHDTSVLSFIPLEDEENGDTAPAGISTDDANVPAEERTGGPEKNVPPAPAVDDEPRARSPDAPAVPPDDAPRPMSADQSAAIPHRVPGAEGGSGPRSRSTPQAVPVGANVASPSGRPAPPRGDENAQRTLAELRRLLTQLAGQGASGALHRAPSPTKGTTPETTGKARSRPASSPTPRPSPAPAATPPAKPLTVTKRPAASVSPPAAPPEKSGRSPVSPPTSKAQASVEQPGEGPPSALPVQPPSGAGSSVIPEAGGKETPGETPAPSAGAASQKATAQPGVPSSPARTPAAPLQPDTGTTVTAPETPAAPPTWLGRLAARLKRTFRPAPSPVKPTPRGPSARPAPPVPAASTAPPSRAATTPAPGNDNESGGLIRRLREMEAEHRARLQALTERPRAGVYPSWEARRNLLNISLGADVPEPARRTAPEPADHGETTEENMEDLRVLLDRPSLFQRLSNDLKDRWKNASFRDGLRAAGGVAALTAVAGALLYAAMNPDRLDQALESLRGLLF